MKNESELLKQKEEYMKAIREFCLYNDLFFRTCLKDNMEATERILRVILGMPTLKVLEQNIQFDAVNPTGHGSRFDVLAKDDTGKLYNLEIENGPYDKVPKRARYYSSLMDTGILLGKGEEYDSLRESYVIFILGDGIIGADRAVYRYSRMEEESGQLLGDGTHIVFVNGSYIGEDEIGDLIRDMRQSDPGRIKDPVLRKTVADHKIEKEDEKMFDIVAKARQDGIDEGREEGLEQGRVEGLEQSKQEIAKKLLSVGDMTVEKIADITGLTVEKVSELAG